MLKAGALKLLCLFRMHLPGQFLVSLLPAVIAHIASKSVVVQTYAAITLERWLSVTDAVADGSQAPRVPAEHLHAHLDALFSTLFAVLDNPELPENEYVMKAIMRLLSLLGARAAGLAPSILPKLTQIFEHVARNPVNAVYNHYMFECYALLIRASCRGAEPAAASRACDEFEAHLFPPFQQVLTADISEFTPYVFQLLAQLLAYRPGTGLSDPYKALFAPLLSPVLWERRGNVPALSELLHSYILRDAPYILSTGSLPGVLGVFQKLLSSRANEAFAYRVLDSLLQLCPVAAMQPYAPTAMQLLLQRLQDAVKDDRPPAPLGKEKPPECRNPRYVRRLLHTVCAYATVHGGAAAAALLDGAHAGLAAQVCTAVWGRFTPQLLAGPAPESRRIVAGIARLITESPLQENLPAWKALLGLAAEIGVTLHVRTAGENGDIPIDDAPEVRRTVCTRRCRMCDV